MWKVSKLFLSSLFDPPAVHGLDDKFLRAKEPTGVGRDGVEEDDCGAKEVTSVNLDEINV